MGKVSVWTAYENWQDSDQSDKIWVGPWNDPMLFNMEGAEDFLDTEFGACAGQNLKVDPTEMLVTKEQHQKICEDNNLNNPNHLNNAGCGQDPDPPVVPPTAEELCAQNSVDISHAEDLCADQRIHGDVIYNDCIYDVCASFDEKARLAAVAGAELEAATLNSEATCAVSPDKCHPCTLCDTATTVDLTNVVQNNLGGLGPDSGAEEIRYANAISLDGQSLDVVLTAEGVYQTPKPQKNGNKGNFGVFTMKSDQTSDFKITFQDSVSGSPVSVKDIALTFYDLDEGKVGKLKETVSACNPAEVYTTSNTELIPAVAGSCHSFSSSTKGTGKDNPQKPDELTKTQADRSVTFEFHARASLIFSAAVGRASRAPRPVMFSFHPAIACGASDSDVNCAQ
jgi:hypothetical protein